MLVIQSLVVGKPDEAGGVQADHLLEAHHKGIHDRIREEHEEDDQKGKDKKIGSNLFIVENVRKRSALSIVFLAQNVPSLRGFHSGCQR
jgi:hypothetical protein